MKTTSSVAITHLLQRLQAGDQGAESELIMAIYPELRRQAKRLFAQERQGHTLAPTALVHEAYLRLVGGEQPDWQNRNHFFSVASMVMRRVLVDHARRRSALKRGEGLPQSRSLEERLKLNDSDQDLVLIVDQALHRLQQLDKRQARIVEMRFFGGLTETQIAAVLGIADRTVKRDWQMAKAWLQQVLGPNANATGS